jgi:hypothetical protein
MKKILTSLFLIALMSNIFGQGSSKMKIQFGDNNSYNNIQTDVLYLKGDKRVLFLTEKKQILVETLNDKNRVINTTTFNLEEGNKSEIININLINNQIYLLSSYTNEKRKMTYLFSQILDCNTKTVGTLNMIMELGSDFKWVDIVKSPDKGTTGIIFQKDTKTESRKVFFIFNKKMELMNPNSNSLNIEKMPYNLNLNNYIDNEGNLIMIYRGYRNNKEAYEGYSYPIGYRSNNTKSICRNQNGVLSVSCFMAHDDYNGTRYIIDEKQFYIRELEASIFSPDSILFTGAYSHRGNENINYQGYISFLVNPYEDESIDISNASTFPITMAFRLKTYDKKDDANPEGTNMTKVFHDFYTLKYKASFRFGLGFVTILEEQASSSDYKYYNNFYVLYTDLDGNFINVLPLRKRQTAVNSILHTQSTYKTVDDKLLILYESWTNKFSGNAGEFILFTINDDLSFKASKIDVSKQEIRQMNFIDEYNNNPIFRGYSYPDNNNKSVKFFSLDIEL